MNSIKSNSQRTFLTLTFYTDCSGNITKDFLENPGSLASSKIQLLPMLKTAINNGDKVQIWSLHSEAPQDLEIMLGEKNIDTVFIGKMSAGPISKQQSMILANTAAVLRLKQQGAKIILFYSDNHFERKDRIGEFYRSIFEFVDLFVTPSKTLEEIVRRKTNYVKPCITVVDPWQSQKNDFDDENIKNKARLIWFGQGRNIDYLISKIPTLLSQCEASKCYELTILSRADALRHFKKQLPKKLIGKKQWIFKFVVWDDFDQPSQFDKCLLDSSISLIPSDPNDPNSGGAEPVLPTEGFWSFASPTIGTDGCNIGGILTTLGMGIGDILPEGFDVSGVGVSSFTGSMAGSSTTCALTGANFSCGSITTTETFDLSQAGLSGSIDIEMAVSLNGAMSDSENMDLDLGLDVVSCDGASCSLLSFIGLSIPCSVQLTGSASLD